MNYLPPRPQEDAVIYHHPLLPGLLLVPNLMPPTIQKSIVSRLVHRDLSQPHHQTNMHLNYDVPYPEVDPDTNKPASFFTRAPDSETRFIPKDPSVHKSLSMRQVMGRKLHWVTLGGQYDWTNRVYPGEKPPQFPPDISGLLETLFPQTLAQAAIVNFYTPGDTMMMHRDVSEETNKGLVSLSIGCDALFSKFFLSSYGHATADLGYSDCTKRRGQDVGSRQTGRRREAVPPTAPALRRCIVHVGRSSLRVAWRPQSTEGNMSRLSGGLAR